MTTVLTVNAGSGSLKAHLVDAGTERVRDAVEVEQPPDSDEAGQVLDKLLDQADRDVAAVGHRLVHGGPDLRAAAVVDEDAVAAARRAESLAPLHLPPALRLLEKLRERLPDVPHVLCPDTAFHADLPDVAATYPLPLAWRERHGLRRYGFHGLSYRWTLDRTARILDRSSTELCLLLTHLGGGCSVCAVREGRSVDTSMGFTPLEGVPMAKRSGSVDPGMLLWLLRHGGLDADTLEDGLNHESGLLGLSGGRSDDTRDLVAAAADGDDTADLALRVFTHRVRRELAAAATSLPRIDALVFTGEIGWDQPEVRTGIVEGLSLLGIPTDLTSTTDGDGLVSPSDATVPVLVVQPREELQLCRDTMTALNQQHDG
ncbi:acetate/propionate family kinase [Actinophytocola algeriensis]|uniref:Acetate kinase n=1 Tax=Actinophytocola algeriensis TaxID=1768010 RepID=A0A7W7QG45_9PSEU|nr:acetate/propionate family kinase [Actinophytocola algeriensis]MBB4912754.1 acetate kinase [Actinophytocola algeriensis]MBE1473578.1 acetate kinase [Actinophytocola algeriensis]